MEKKRIVAYYIHKNLLPLATKLMNETSGGIGNPCFESRIIDIIKMEKKDCRFNPENELIIVVEIEGYYPYIISEWVKKLEVTQDFVGERVAR